MKKKLKKYKIGSDFEYENNQSSLQGNRLIKLYDLINFNNYKNGRGNGIQIGIEK